MADSKTDAKKVKFLEVKLAASTGWLTFAFGNGAKVTFDPAKCKKEIRAQAETHGFVQKLRDSTAGYSKENDFTGAQAELTKVIEALYAGSWNRQGGSGSGVVMEDLAYAIAKHQKADFNKAMKAVENASEEQRKTWSKNATIALYMAESKVARLKKASETAPADDLKIELD